MFLLGLESRKFPTAQIPGCSLLGHRELFPRKKIRSKLLDPTGVCALPPRAPTTAADDFAFCVYAVVAVAVLAAVAEMLAPNVRMDCLCLAPASLLIFVHARPPISLDVPLAIAVMLVFAGAAALACARRMLHKPGGDPGGAYARVGSSDVRRQSSLQENLLDDDDYKEDEPPESPTTTIRKRNLEMVERGGEFV